MWNSIQPSTLPAILAALALAACDRPAETPRATVEAAPASAPASPAAQDVPPLSGQIDEPVEPATASAVIAREDIVVDGKPACAIDVRYVELQDQPVTWRGEPCGKLTVRFLTLAELAALGQDGKLDPDARDDLARLAGGKALYVEGEYASALFPANVEGVIYRVPLAD